MTHQTTPLRVLFIGVSWPPETFLARLIRGLAERDIQITVATSGIPDEAWRSTAHVDFRTVPSWTGSRARLVMRTGYEIASSAVRSPAGTARVWAEARQVNVGLSLAEQLFRWLPFTGEQWDVLYFPWNAAAIIYMPLMDRMPAVISCRGAQINVAPYHPRRHWLREALAETFARAAAVHCVSEAICAEAVQFGLDRRKATIIRPAVDPEMFQQGVREPRAEEVLRIIMTGSIVWRKGYEYALSALQILRQRGIPVHLEIVGRGDENQRLLYTINDLELADSVTWQGSLSPADVVGRLQKADVFLLTSLSEGISNAVLEAMSCGLPVVTTNVDGMGEAVTDGVEGLLVPPRDAAAVADALAHLWARPDIRCQMGEAGRARIMADFRLEDQITAFEQLFRSVC